MKKKIKYMLRIILLFQSLCMAYDNYGFSYYHGDKNPNFKFEKTYYYINFKKLNIGLNFIPIEMGPYKLQFERFESGNEELRYDTHYFNSIGVGPIFKIKIINNLNLVSEYNFLMNIDGLNRFFYHKLESHLLYSISDLFDVGFSYNYRIIQNKNRDQSEYTRQTYEGLDVFSLGLSIKKKFNPNIISNGFDGIVYLFTGLRILLSPLKGP